MKSLPSNSFRILPTAIGLGLCLLVNHAGAAFTTWDPQGSNAQNPYTGSLSGTWENNNWSTTETGQATPGAWVENTAALFAVNSGTGTPAFTVTMNANHTVAGIFDGGGQTPSPCPVTISGSGTMILPSGSQPFDITSNTGDAGTLTINNVIAGSGALTASGSGTLTLSGANTYTGITTISNGLHVYITSDSNLGAAPGSATANQLTLNYGYLRDNSGNWSLSANRGVTLGAGQSLGGMTVGGFFIAASGYTLTIPSVITGPSGIISGNGNNNTGLGTNLLTGASTYTGGTGVSCGRLKLGASEALPYGTVLMIASDNSAAGNGGGAIFDLGGNSQTIGPLSSIGNFSGGGGGATPTIVLSGNLTILQTNVSSTFSGNIIGSGGTLTVNGSGANSSTVVLVLSGTNTYTGATTIANGGQVNIVSDSGLGAAPASPVANQLTLNYGWLRANTNVTLNANRGITLGAGQSFGGLTLGGSIQVAGGYTLTIPSVITGPSALISGGGTATLGTGTNLLTGASSYTGGTGISCGRLLLGANGALPAGTPLIIASDNAGGAIFDLGGYSQTIGPLSSIGNFSGSSGGAAPTIVLTGPLTILQTTNTTFAGQIIGSGGTLTLNGTAALTLSGTSTYTGATTVSAGELAGVTGGSCANSTVTVSSGATNSVSITDNTKQWTCGGLTCNSGSALDFNFGYSVTPSTSLAPLNVNGDVTFNDTPAVTIEAGGFPAGTGTYPLITWSGSQLGTAPAPATATLPPHVIGTLSVSNNTLYLNVSASTQPLKWTGAAHNSIWDINTSQNWDDSGANPADYEQTTLPGDAVILDETYITASQNIALDTVVTPVSVTVSNSTYNYAVSGTGGIAGPIGLTKLGSATLTLGCANIYSGSTTIAGGTVSVGADSNLGAVPASTTAASITLSNSALSANNTLTLNTNRGITLRANSTLDVASGKTLSYGGVIAGPSYNLTKTGPGTLILSQNHNTYSGGTIISAGILQTGGDRTSLGAAANLGDTPSSFTPDNITLAGGTLQGNNPNFAFNPNRGVTLTADSGLSALANCQMGVAGPITGDYSLTMTSPGGNGIVYLEGTNTYTGNTVISSGVLALWYNASISNSPSISIAAAAALDVSSLTNGTFTLAGGQSLTASGSGVMSGGLTNIASSTAAVLNGPANGAVSLGSRPIILNFTPASFNGDATHPSLYVLQGALSLNGNPFTVTNAAGTPLGAGTNVLIQQASGNISSSGSYPVSVTGTGLASGTTASISVSGATVNLIVQTATNTPLKIVVPPAYNHGTGAFTVTYTGSPNHAYTIYTATSVTGPWSVVGTATADGSGLFTVADTRLPSAPARFYWIKP